MKPSPSKVAQRYAASHLDGESYMSVQALQSLKDHAADLLGQVTNTTPLPDWVEAKLTRAAQSINDVYEYMNHGRGQRLASSLLPLAKKVDRAIGKTMQQAPRLLKTYERHHGTYKGDPAKAQRAKEKFYALMGNTLHLLQSLIVYVDDAVRDGTLPDYLESGGTMVPLLPVRRLREAVAEGRKSEYSDLDLVWKGKHGEAGAEEWLEMAMQDGGYAHKIQQAMNHGRGQQIQ